MLSPVDWALIEEWEQRGIPLKIVLATIDEVFDQLEADPKRAGSVRTLTYCRDAVESRYQTWKESMVGAAEGSAGRPEDDAPAGEKEFNADGERELEDLAASLRSASDGLEGPVRMAVAAAIAEIESLKGSKADQEEIESALDRIDGEIDSALLNSASDDEVRTLREAALFELGSRSGLMEKDVLARTTEIMVKKELRQASGIPQIGMFRL